MCNAKNVVYEATCNKCTVIHQEQDPQLEQHILREPGGRNTHQAIYVGETSRQLGVRSLEHVNNLKNLKPDSFILQHWMSEHGMDTIPPTFTFKRHSTHHDALGRQIREALLIRKRGNLNRKDEYGMNEIIKLEPTRHQWEEEHLRQESQRSKYVLDQKIRNFIDVMSGISVLRNKLPCKRTREESNLDMFQINNNKKLRSMYASTPRSYREVYQPSPESSPGSQSLLGDSGHSQDGTGNCSELAKKSDEAGGLEKSKTNISPGVEVLLIKTPVKEKKELQLARQHIAANEHGESVDSYRRRADSLPTTNQEWKVVIKPGKIVEKRELGPLMSMNKLLEGLNSGDIYDSVEAESDNEEEWYLNELFDETQANEDEWYLNQLFGESDVDVREVEKIIIKKTKNTLFDKFAEDYNRRYQKSPEKRHCETPNKRKLSPGNEHGTDVSDRKLKKMKLLQLAPIFSRTRRATLSFDSRDLNSQTGRNKNSSIARKKRNSLAASMTPTRGQKTIPGMLDGRKVTARDRDGNEL